MISVVIPVYNTQAYLPQCLESLRTQSFTDFEALVIDDGSSDSSGFICDQFAREDDRFRVFHLENGGISRARNTALDHARGDYIAFLDSDDWMEPNMLEFLFSMVNGNGDDAAICDIYNVDRTIRSKANLVKDLSLSAKDKEIHRIFLGRSGTVWNKLIGKSCIGNTRFREDLRYGEDIRFLHDIANNISTLNITDMPLYNYRRMREGNTITSKLSTKYADFLEVMELVVDFLLDNHYYLDAVSRIRLCTGRILKAAAYASLAESKEYRKRCLILLRKGCGKAHWLLKNHALSLPIRCIRFLEYMACLISPILVVLIYKLILRLKKGT